MARKTAKTAVAPIENDAATAPAEPAIKTVKARQSPVPRSAKPSAKSAAPAASNGHAIVADSTDVGPKAVCYGDIAKRAYELWQSGAPGGEFDHWCAAERELRG